MIYGERLNILAVPVLFLAFLVKPVFHLIGKEAVIKLTKWPIKNISINHGRLDTAVVLHCPFVLLRMMKLFATTEVD